MIYRQWGDNDAHEPILRRLAVSDRSDGRSSRIGRLPICHGVALKNWSEDSEQRGAGPVIIWVCRLLIGAQWFQGCLWKLPLPVSGGFQYWTGQMGEHAAFSFHRNLVKSVYLPFIHIIDPLVFLAELAFAVSLMLGIGVRLVATIAAIYSLHIPPNGRGIICFSRSCTCSSRSMRLAAASVSTR